MAIFSGCKADIMVELKIAKIYKMFSWGKDSLFLFEFVENYQILVIFKDGNSNTFWLQNFSIKKGLFITVNKFLRNETVRNLNKKCHK